MRERKQIFRAAYGHDMQEHSSHIVTMPLVGMSMGVRMRMRMRMRMRVLVSGFRAIFLVMSRLIINVWQRLVIELIL